MKTINAEFIRTRASSQFSFGQFRSYATSFPGLLLTLTLTWKSKMIPGTSLDLTPSFKTSVDARVEGLVSNVDYLENWFHAFIQNKYGRKGRLLRTHVSFSGLWFFFLYGVFTPLMTPKELTKHIMLIMWTPWKSQTLKLSRH